MITPSLPSNLANVIATFSPVGKMAVGEENIEARNTPFKPVEELAESNRQENRASTAERAALAEERVEFDPQGDERDSDEDGKQDKEARGQQDQEQEKEEQLIIGDLAARDREVRAHEQAHSAVGGSLAGSPSYQYQRGPDGVSYAVSGEVPISTGQVSGDPEATLRNARIVQRAALAPAEPSPQDRRVAAEAARVEQRAIQDLAAFAAEEREQQAAEIEAEREAAEQQREQEQARLNESQQNQQPLEQRESEDQAEFTRTSIDLNRRLIEIGVVATPTPIGGLLNLSA